LRFGDLRRSGMTEAADAGATDDELRAQSGHKTRNIVAVYVRSTPKQAGNAIAKRVRHRTQKERLSE
jgi:integrase